MLTAGRSGAALVGFMGVGKSTAGAALAARLGWPLVDLDQILTERFGPIPGQVARDGWPVFRARERAVVRELCDGSPKVLATGGGAWTDPESRTAIAAHFRTFWLDAPFSVLAARVGSGGGRPLWDERAAALFAERAHLYAEAEVRVDASRSVEDIVEQLVAAMGR